jgi:hypothetical protein
LGVVATTAFVTPAAAMSCDMEWAGGGGNEISGLVCWDTISAWGNVGVDQGNAVDCAEYYGVLGAEYTIAFLFDNDWVLYIYVENNGYHYGGAYEDSALPSGRDASC